jgi:hypothetical protein
MITFEGSWKIDAAGSTVWDEKAGKYAPDEVGEELIRIGIKDGVQDYEVLLGDNPTIRMGYTCRYDDTEWKPYTVREILGVAPQDAETAIAAFVERIKSRVKDYRVGTVYGIVRCVYVDERTHYRLSKSSAGVAEYSMLRRLAEDGESYTSTVLNADGVITRIRRFYRAAI